jgi:hypothetical protein
MTDLISTTTPDTAPRLDVRAMDNLEFIRDTMERAGSFTAVPGIGMIAIGVTALIAAAIAPDHPSQPAWLTTWISEAAISIAIMVVAIAHKSRASGMPLISAPTRKFALAFAPPLFAGAVLTFALHSAAVPHILPGTWLLLYGTAVVTGGAFSVRIVPLMGIAFLVAGIASLVAPVSMTNAILAAAFGGLHIVFGTQIARRHGG